jgi:hypothetical protein
VSADASKLATMAATRSMFARAQRDGFERKNIEADSGISLSTLASWATEIHEMPLSAFRKLIATRALPLEILSLLLPDGVALAPAGEGEMDHAALAGHAMGYVSDYTSARDPKSEAGEALGPGERAALDARGAVLKVAAG